jgi:hypothetical protein
MRMKLPGPAKVCLVAALSLAHLSAATPPIGLASGFGTFTLNSSRIEGNANVFDGSQIRTGLTSSRVYLQGGAALTLGTNSTGTFYKDHLLLEEGAIRLNSMLHYGVQAGPYRVLSAQPASEAIVRLTADSIEVAALRGTVDVYNHRGALLTRIGAGSASSFQPNDTGAPQAGSTSGQSGASAETPEDAKHKRHKQEALFLLLGASLAGLGLAVDAILQPGSAGPTGVGATSP